MLILDRYKQQSIYIGDDITIEVLEVDGLQVCLGITAPKSIVVVREELLQRNPNCLSNGLTNRQSLQENVVQSCTDNVVQPPRAPATKPKVVYKRRKVIKDRN